jgi:hypothetical protein
MNAIEINLEGVRASVYHNQYRKPYKTETKLTRLAMCLADLRARFIYLSFLVYFDKVPNSRVN